MLVEVWTDGACSGNPGRGGCAAILVAKNDAGDVVKRKTVQGYTTTDTTNNLMEMYAVLLGLQAFRKPIPETTKVVVYSDSNYVVKGLNSWVKNWVRNGWKTANKTPVKNKDCWILLLDEMVGFPTDFEIRHVKGHAGIELNEEADFYAVEAMNDHVGILLDSLVADLD